MNKNTRAALRTFAVILVLTAVLLKLDILVVPALNQLGFWMVVIAFGIMLFVSK